MASPETLTAVTDDSWDALVEKQDRLVLALFRTVWSAPSRSTQFALEEVAPQYGSRLKAVQIDMMDNWLTANRYRVRSAPTLMFLFKGREVARYEGVANIENLRSITARVLGELGGEPRPGRRLLVALDDDGLAPIILSTLIGRARLGAEDELFLVHVLPVIPWMSGAARAGGWSRIVRSFHERGGAFLSQCQRRLAGRGVPIETRLAEGRPAEEILRLASELRADLIVLGALDPSQREQLMGSVSEKVKALSHTHLLIVRPGDDDPDSALKVMAAVDGSRESLAALRAFVEHLQADRAKIRLIHVVEALPARWEEAIGRELTGSGSASSLQEQQAEAAFEQTLGLLAARGLDATTEIRRGRAAAEILAAASGFGAQLIVMGSSGLSGFSGLILGSVSERVLRQATTSVLIGRETSGPR